MQDYYLRHNTHILLVAVAEMHGGDDSPHLEVMDLEKCLATLLRHGRRDALVEYISGLGGSSAELLAPIEQASGRIKILERFSAGDYGRDRFEGTGRLLPEGSFESDVYALLVGAAEACATFELAWKRKALRFSAAEACATFESESEESDDFDDESSALTADALKEILRDIIDVTPAASLSEALFSRDSVIRELISSADDNSINELFEDLNARCNQHLSTLTPAPR